MNELHTYGIFFLFLLLLSSLKKKSRAGGSVESPAQNGSLSTQGRVCERPQGGATRPHIGSWVWSLTQIVTWTSLTLRRVKLEIVFPWGCIHFKVQSPRRPSALVSIDQICTDLKTWSEVQQNWTYSSSFPSNQTYRLKYIPHTSAILLICEDFKHMPHVLSCQSYLILDLQPAAFNRAVWQVLKVKTCRRLEKIKV